jgi:hypothetical protein
VETEHRAALDILFAGHDVGLGDPEERRQFLPGGMTPQPGQERILRGPALAGLGSHRAGRPVGGTQLVDNRPTDPGRGETGEGHAKGRVKGTGSLHQRGQSGGRQLIFAHVGRQSADHLGDDEADECHVVEYQALPRLRGAGSVAFGHTHLSG